MNSQDLARFYDFTNRTILITGGTGLLGGAMAEGLVAAGANVAVLARDSAKAEATLPSRATCSTAPAWSRRPGPLPPPGGRWIP
jgi:NAD(P)-dependent dehydrogenase (short-subunit alcohol dehydrogenase family)